MLFNVWCHLLSLVPWIIPLHSHYDPITQTLTWKWTEPPPPPPTTISGGPEFTCLVRTIVQTCFHTCLNKVDYLKRGTDLVKDGSLVQASPNDLLTWISHAVLVSVVGGFKRPFVFLSLYHWLHYIPYLFCILVDLFLLKSWWNKF